jgi:hypothetical protein
MIEMVAPDTAPVHEWPKDGEHLWGPWMSKRYAPPKSLQYRTCVHPECKAFEERVVPNV